MDIKNILKKKKKHLWQYLILIFSGIIFLILLSVFKSQRLNQFIVFIAFVSFYICWGIYHHITDNRLNLKIVIEYIIIGFIVILLVKLLLI